MTFTDSAFPDAMHEVLQTSRYDVLMGRRQRFQEIIVEWIGNFFERLFNRFDFEFSPTAINTPRGIVSTSFTIIGIILAIVALVFVYKNFLRKYDEYEYDLSDIFEELAKKNYTVSELIRLSEDAETDANRRLAIRYRYIAAILHLTEKQIIEIKPSATNAVIAAQIRVATPSLLPRFKVVADAFHLAWFGYKDIDDSAYTAFAAQISAIISCENGDSR